MAVELSGAEFRLLKIFVERPHRVLNRDQLMDLLHGRDTEPFDRSIDVRKSAACANAWATTPAKRG